jgi:hypothetical protein
MEKKSRLGLGTIRETDAEQESGNGQIGLAGRP